MAKKEKSLAHTKWMCKYHIVFATLAKQLGFDSYYSFILTDFFEGLHYGHYPRKCEICGRYFFMQSARRQKYCPYGIAPELYRGKKITCRKYAAVMNRKEKYPLDGRSLSIPYETGTAGNRKTDR